jgi:hypothetical protein
MSAVVQISAGTGPEPVRRFVAALARHLLERCEASGEVVLDVLRRGDSSAPLSVTIHLEVMPPWLVALVGTHALVARSADRGKRSRKRWFAGVRVTDLPARESSRRLQRDDVQLSTMRASGPGGQHVNKTCSAVRLVHGASGLSVSRLRRTLPEGEPAAGPRAAPNGARRARERARRTRGGRLALGTSPNRQRPPRGYLRARPPRRSSAMRRDMFEVIVERPRGGGHSAKGRRKERGERALARTPKQLGMGRTGQTKFLSENLAPLIRYLSRRVGQPWDAVRSEMSQVLSVRSAVQKHVLDHVKQLVELHPRMIDGVPARAPSERRCAQATVGALVCPVLRLPQERPPLCGVTAAPSRMRTPGAVAWHEMVDRRSNSRGANFARFSVRRNIPAAQPYDRRRELGVGQPPPLASA